MSKIKMEKYEDLMNKFSFEKSEFYWLVIFINQYGPPKKFVGIKTFFTLKEIKKLQDETLELTVRHNASKTRYSAWKVVSYLFPLNFIIYFFMLFLGTSFREQIFQEKRSYKKYLTKLSDVRQKLSLLEILLDKLIKTNDNEIPTNTQCEKEYPEFYRWKSSVDVACSLFSQMARIGNTQLVKSCYLASFTGSNSQKPLESFMDFVSMQLDLLSVLKIILPEEEMKKIEAALKEEKEKRAQLEKESMDVLQVCQRILAPEDYEKVVQGIGQINNYRAKTS